MSIAADTAVGGSKQIGLRPIPGRVESHRKPDRPCQSDCQCEKYGEEHTREDSRCSLPVIWKMDYRKQYAADCGSWPEPKSLLQGSEQIASEDSLFAEASYQKALCPDYAVVDLKRGGLGAWRDFENSERELYQENECECGQSSGQAERDFAVTRPLPKIPFCKRRLVYSAHDEQRDEHRDGDEYFTQERVV